MLKITGDHVLGIENALVTAGYPLQTVVNISKDLTQEWEKLIKRGERLGKTPCGEGHDKFLRFITVIATVEAPRYWWQEFSTYHFAEMNSQSTMHRITKMDIESCCNEYVDKRVINLVTSLIEQYNENPSTENFLKVKSNLPEGFMLSAGICTNYSQLKTMYKQRKGHRLPEWHRFCEWIEGLPFVKEFGVVA